jgi:hypothetical protein
MDYQLGGSIVFLFLLAIAVFSYLQSSRRSDVLDRRRRDAEIAQGRHDRYDQR